MSTGPWSWGSKVKPRLLTATLDFLGKSKPDQQSQTNSRQCQADEYSSKALKRQSESSFMCLKQMLSIPIDNFECKHVLDFENTVQAGQISICLPGLSSPRYNYFFNCTKNRQKTYLFSGDICSSWVGYPYR